MSNIPYPTNYLLPPEYEDGNDITRVVTDENITEALMIVSGQQAVVEMSAELEDDLKWLYGEQETALTCEQMFSLVERFVEEAGI